MPTPKNPPFLKYALLFPVLALGHGYPGSTWAQPPGEQPDPPASTAPNDANCASPDAAPASDRPIAATVDVPATLPAGLLTGSRQRDASCYLAPEVVSTRLAEGAMQLIDIRDEKAFERYRIPGSMHIPAYALKTKAFLKAKPLALVDDGPRFDEMEALCRELRRNGFAQVYVLEGGLHDWRRRIAPLAGDPLASPELDRLSPRVFFTERDYAHWLTIDVSSQPAPITTANAKAAVAIPASLGRDRFLNQLQSAIARRKANAPVYVLILNPSGDYQDVAAWIDAAGIAHVYYLDGGLAGYQAFLTQQQAMLNRTPLSQRPSRCRAGG